MDSPVDAKVDHPDLPIWGILLPNTHAEYLYGFPRMSKSLPGPHGFKAAIHDFGVPVDPDSYVLGVEDVKKTERFK
jgi:hypothetical protein